MFSVVSVDYMVENVRLVALWSVILPDGDTENMNAELIGASLNVADYLGYTYPMIACHLRKPLEAGAVFSDVFLLDEKSFPSALGCLVMNDLFIKKCLSSMSEEPETLMEQINAFFNNDGFLERLKNIIDDGCVLVGVAGVSPIHLNRGMMDLLEDDDHVESPATYE